ncbi:hypothetical protein NIES4071_108350 (plasmid) [Calothrix sp. NIES-4071]|nr:hypothetical protein NIES4071_108350 [Calothrix sp. NIES-4071]BAZ64875.1 hypothetical protein NIES4105_106080 [Calothrix sp. NIES-4105]
METILLSIMVKFYAKQLLACIIEALRTQVQAVEDYYQQRYECARERMDLNNDFNDSEWIA